MEDIKKINDYHENAMGIIFDSFFLNEGETIKKQLEELHDCELEANGEGACSASEHKEV